MAYYPEPNSTDMESIYTIFSYIHHQASGGIFFPVILLVIWVVGFILILAQGRQPVRAWIYASFISTILGIMLALMGFLNKQFIYILVLMLAFGMVWAKLSNSALD